MADEKTTTPPEEESRPTAKPAYAIPGLSGIAVGGEQTGDDLVGKVPITPERMRP